MTTFALDVADLREVIYTSEGNACFHLPSLIVAESAAGETRYLLSDGLGSVRQAVDENGAVVAYNEFDPYGNPVEGGGEPYGFTGEWWENDVNLLHLRARWYSVENGTFLSRDLWEGNIHWPQSLNGYGYVAGNPIQYTDPAGLCPLPGVPQCDNPWLPIEELWEYAESTIRDNFISAAEGVVQSASSNVQGLIRLFEADHFPGKDAKGRLRWILDITGSPRAFGLQFSLFPLGDSGFCEELADEKFYTPDYWDGNPDRPNSRQTGHFLTAVSLGFDPETAYNNVAFLFDTYKIWRTPYIFSGNPHPPTAEEFALNLIVGHEIIGDLPHIGQFISIPEQYAAATTEARELFKKAVEADRNKSYGEREEYLRIIFGDPLGREAIPDFRIGNSMPDLRLSVKGWRFGQEVRNGYAPDGPLQTRREAADWLRREVYAPSRTRKFLGQ